MGYYTPNVSVGQEQMRQAMAMRSEGAQNIAQSTQALGQNTAQWATHFSNLAEGRHGQRLHRIQYAERPVYESSPDPGPVGSQGPHGRRRGRVSP